LLFSPEFTVSAVAAAEMMPGFKSTALGESVKDRFIGLLQH
jgi:hypothetical protein